MLCDEFNGRGLIGVDGREMSVVRLEDLGENVFDLEKSSSQHGISEVTLPCSKASRSILLVLPLRGQHSLSDITEARGLASRSTLLALPLRD